MLDSRSALGVAEIAFYAPILVLAFMLAFVRHGRPRMPWWFLLTFSCFRLASGIVSVLYQQDLSNVGLLIAATITLNVGVIPLLLCTIGFIRLIAKLDHADSKKLRKAILLTRVCFFIGIALLVAGGVLVGMYNQPSLPHTGSILTKAGYIVIACILVLMIVFEAFLWTQHHQIPLSRSSNMCLIAISTAMPFQIVRIAYSLLTVFHPQDPRWNALTGELGAFIGMVLVMEYIVVIIYVTTGFMIAPVPKTMHDSRMEAIDQIGDPRLNIKNSAEV